MIDLREMYLVALEQIKQVLGSEPIDFRFEQFKEDEKAHINEIVVSYLVERKPKSGLTGVGSFPSLISEYERIYKIIQLTDDKKLVAILMYPN